jgi:hypothetical protein
VATPHSVRFFPGWAPGPVWTGAEKSGPPPTGIRSPDRPVCRESLYRLSYPCPQSLYQLSYPCPQSLYRLSYPCPQSLYRLSYPCPQSLYRLSYPCPQSLYRLSYPCPCTVAVLVQKYIECLYIKLPYRYAPHNDFSVNDGPHIRRWSRNIIIPLCYNYLQHSAQ